MHTERRFDHEYRICKTWREQVMIQNIAGLSRLNNLVSGLMEAFGGKPVANYQCLAIHFEATDRAFFYIRAALMSPRLNFPAFY
jgi:hypothetical protein